MGRAAPCERLRATVSLVHRADAAMDGAARRIGEPAAMRTLAHAPHSMLGWLAVLGLCAALAAGVSAQTAPTVPAKKSATTHKQTHKRKAAAEAKPAAPVLPPAPPEPEKPKWPINETPQKAAVTWDSHGLRISAANSSLHQILEDYETATGSKIDGMGPDERVFGNYGPGEARDVLAQLFTGTGYNLVMVGDLGRGAPRQIVLSRRVSSGGQQARPVYTPQPAVEEEPAENESNDDQQQGPPQPLVQQPGAPADQQPRTPQQIMQEMQQRQQQLQQQQDQQPPQ